MLKLRFLEMTSAAQVNQINELNCSGNCYVKVAVKIHYEQGMLDEMVMCSITV